VHNGTIGLDWPSDDIVSILEVDDDDLRRRVVIELLANTDVVVRF
jgi:uncharacterized protein with GYD domain